MIIKAETKATFPKASEAIDPKASPAIQKMIKVATAQYRSETLALAKTSLSNEREDSHLNLPIAFSTE
jgi:hypothetical protein